MIREEDIKIGAKFLIKTLTKDGKEAISNEIYEIEDFVTCNSARWVKAKGTDKLFLCTMFMPSLGYCQENNFSLAEIVDSNESLQECLEKVNKAGQEMYDSISFDGITKKMLDTYTKKNHDYGNAFSEMYDELGINYGYGKIREKVNRIKTLKDGDAMVENEPLEDALLDCANYCILTLMEYQKHKKDGKD